MTRNEALKVALEECARRREDARRERDARLNEAGKLDPRLAALSRMDARRFAELARQTVAEPERANERRALLEADLREGKRAMAQLLAAKGLPVDYFDEHCACPLCRDTGYVGESVRSLCECVERRVFTLTSNPSDAEQRFEVFDEALYPPESRPSALGARELCRAFAESYPDTRRRNMLITGECGLGKTFLINCVANRLLERGFAPRKENAYQLFAIMRGAHFGDDEAARELRRVIDCPLLLIDDLGSEPMLNNVTIEYFFMLINERLAARRHTVVATNLDPEKIGERYGERLMSRLLSRADGSVVRLVGKDIRRTAKK